MKLDCVGPNVSNVRIRYFDTLPTAVSLCISKFGLLFAASEFANQYVPLPSFASDSLLLCVPYLCTTAIVAALLTNIHASAFVCVFYWHSFYSAVINAKVVFGEFCCCRLH